MRPINLHLAVGALATAGLLFLTQGCFTPAIVLAAKVRAASDALAVYPPGSEVVEVPVAEIGFLRGIYCPAEASGGVTAPVALHLMESGASPSNRKNHYGMVVSAYRRLGFSSLLLDYSGVGNSDGKRSPKNLRRDVDAAFQEAARRAGGQQDRVLVRATSLGTIAVAELLESGARPGALVLISPVDPRNVASRGARALHGSLAGWLVATFFGSASDADLTKALQQASKLPLFIAMGEDDRFVTDEWREKMHHVTTTGRRVEYLLPGGHIQLAGLSRDILVESELPFLLSQVQMTAKMDGDMTRRAIAEIILRPRRSMDEEGREALLDMTDPSGRLPLDLLEELTRAARFSRFLNGSTSFRDLERLVGADGRHGWESRSATLTGGHVFELRTDPSAVYDSLVVRGYSSPDLERVFARLLLKAAAIPDRIICDGHGGFHVQQRGSDGWVEFAIDD